MTALRKPAYAQEVMLRVSWSVINHSDGKPQHARRGETMLDLGLEGALVPELTGDEMQRVAFAAKMAALKALRQRPRVKLGRLKYTEAQIDAMADDGRLGRLAMKMAIDAGKDWPSLDVEDRAAWDELAIQRLRSELRTKGKP